MSSCLGCTGFSSCGSWDELLSCMWALPGSGMGPMSPALAGRFFTTEAPGEPSTIHLEFIFVEKLFRRLEYKSGERNNDIQVKPAHLGLVSEICGSPL